MAADSVLVPIQCEFFALEGISELMDTIDRIRDAFDHPLKVEGILLTMFDDRTNLTRQVAADFKDSSATRCSKPSSRAASASPRPPASASPSWSMTPDPVGPKATFTSPKRSSIMNKPDNPRRASVRVSAHSCRPAPTQPALEIPGAAADHSISIDLIDPNPLQPRRVFHNERLSELAQSIRTNGIIQPLVVRRLGDRYQLVAGERRWRAAKLAGADRVPVVVQDIPDDRLLEITLIENIQREDLNPIETAVAFERLGRDLDLSPDQIGQRTGKDRTTVANFLRLLQLPQDLQQLIGERRLSAGHARCLLTLPTPELQREVAEKAVAAGLVRPSDGAHHPAHDGGPQAQARGRGCLGPQRQSRHPGNGAGPRNQGADRRESQAEGEDRNRLLLCGGPRSHLRRHRRRKLTRYFSMSRISASSLRISGNGSSANNSCWTFFDAAASRRGLRIARVCRAPSMVNRFSYSSA